MGFLSLFKKGSGAYYGSESYKRVERLIASERDLLIVSPYIDDYYAAYLAAHSRGKKIHIISSSITGSAAKRLHRNDTLRSSLTATFLSVSVSWLLFLLDAFNPIYSLATIAAGVLLVSYAFMHRSSIYLKIPKDFVHAKMYVGDSSAVEGSANLTYAGMHKNIEGVRLITDPKEVDALKHQFWTLWNSL